MWVIVLGLLSMGTPRAEAGPRGAPVDCRPIILEALDSVPVTEDFELTEALAQGVAAFDLGFSRADCRREAAEVLSQILTLAADRLVRILETRKDLQQYHREFKTFLAAWPQDRRLALAQSEHFQKAHQAYSKLLYAGLSDELGTPENPWREYRSIHVDLDAWTEQWTSDLGRNEPAAVNLLNRRIALQSQSLEPEAMRVLLFHELAHLADPKRPQRKMTRKELYENELYAWRQTFLFLDARAHQGRAIPDHFRFRVYPAVKAMGLEAWVRGILMSRGR